MVKRKILSITFLTSVLALNFINPCLAIFERAILSKIAITPQKNGTYKILIKTDREVPFNKITASENKIVIDIKNVKASKFVNTVYNNALGVDHVIVQPVSNNRVKVFIEGERISRSNIVIDSRRGFSVFEGLNKEIDYSEPVYYNNQSGSGYKQSGFKSRANYDLGSPGVVEPVKLQEPPVDRMVVEQVNRSVKPERKIVKTSQPVNRPKENNKEVNKKSVNRPVVDTVNNQAVQNANSQVSAGYTGNQNKNNYNQENYQGVNYLNNRDNYPSQSRSNNMSAPSRMSVMSDEGVFSKLFSLDIFDWGLRFLILAFIIVASYKLFFRKQPKYTIDLTNDDMRERELALLKSMNDKYAATSTPDSGYERKASKKGGYSSFTQYGLNEYQNSQLPPGSKPSKAQKYPGVRRQQVQAQKSTVRKKVQQAENIPGKPKMTSRNSESINIDNNKFLEKMAKIYEKSGRSDLAEGIQNNIKKRTIM